MGVLILAHQLLDDFADLPVLNDDTGSIKFRKVRDLQRQLMKIIFIWTAFLSVVIIINKQESICKINPSWSDPPKTSALA